MIFFIENEIRIQIFCSCFYFDEQVFYSIMRNFNNWSKLSNKYKTLLSEILKENIYTNARDKKISKFFRWEVVNDK